MRFRRISTGTAAVLLSVCILFNSVPDMKSMADFVRDVVMASGEFREFTDSNLILTSEGDTTLQEQIDSIPESDDGHTATITLDSDYTENITIPFGYNVTLDMNGHTLRQSAAM